MTTIAKGHYRCDRCGTEAQKGRLPRGWHLRDGAHVCKECWSSEPAERSAVWRYDVLRVWVPGTFWHEQRAARFLWDALVGLSDAAFAAVQELRARYAPAEVAVATAQAERARLAWEVVRSADGPSREEAVSRARAESALSQRLYGEAKRAAKAAGCDESEVWRLHEQEQSQAATWTYRETTDERGRASVERALDGQTVETSSASQGSLWRLPSGLAYQILEEYRAAWSAWVKQPGRRRPRAHGLGLGDTVRHVLRYTNGSDWQRLTSGTPSCTIRVLAPCRRYANRGRRLVRFEFAAGLSADVILHRPLPVDRDAIRGVRLVGRRSAVGGWRWSVLVTCRTAARRAEPAPHRADAVAVDLRWRMDEDDRGNLIVAGWRDTDRGWGYVTLDRDAGNARQRKARWPAPSSWNDFLRLQAEIDNVFEWIKAGVWQAHGQVAAYSQPYRLMRAAGLLRAWKRGDYPLAEAGIASWSAWHRSRSLSLERCRRRVLARRDQLYYTEARRIAAAAKVIVLEAEKDGRKMDIRQLIALDDAPAGDQRQLLAPGRFRQILCQVAPEYGTEVVMVAKHRTSTTCPECGAQATAGSALRLTCANGHRYDQIEGACRELLRRWREWSDGDENAGGARGGKSTVRAGVFSRAGRTGGDRGQETAAALASAGDSVGGTRG
jgi:hypothetical protein